MKGFLSALTILAVLISLLFFYSIYINRSFSVFSEDLNKIENSVLSENFKEARTLSETFRESLTKKSRTLYMVTDRDPIDNALAECERMISFIYTEDKSEALAAVGGINIILQKTKEKSLMRLFSNKETEG